MKEYLPVDPAAYYLQYHYIVANPYPPERRELLDDAGDGSAYSRQHAIYHPLLRDAATTFGFFDLMLADPAASRIVYAVRKEVDFAASLRSAPFRQSNLAVAVAHCGADAEKYAACLEDFAPYAPSGGAPIAFMAAPIIDQNVVVGVLIAQLSIDEIDKVVTGGRRWRQDGFGATGEAYLVGSDNLARSGPRAFYENRNRYYADLKSSGAPTRRSTPSGATARRCSSSVSPRRRSRPHSPGPKVSARSSDITASRRLPPGGPFQFPASSGS